MFLCSYSSFRSQIFLCRKLGESITREIWYCQQCHHVCCEQIWGCTYFLEQRGSAGTILQWSQCVFTSMGSHWHIRQCHWGRVSGWVDNGLIWPWHKEYKGIISQSYFKTWTLKLAILYYCRYRSQMTMFIST